ncbi:hypothetical protein ACF0H5_010315 [Mactra antiquata]
MWLIHVSTLCVLLSIAQLGHAFIDKDVYQCLVDQGFSSFALLLKTANLDTTLTGPGPYTVLAPTNAAIAQIDPNLLSTLNYNDMLMKQVLKYHIVNSYQITPSLVSDGTVLTSIGQPLTIERTPMGVVLNNASTMEPTKTDVICNNGIIHGIDSVMLPPIYSPFNLATVMVKRDDIFKNFFLYALIANLTHLVETAEYTIFAPTDLAFGRYSHLNDITPNTPNSAMIYLEVLKYHLVPGARYSYQLKDGQTLYTLHGSPITVHMPGNNTMVDSAKVVEANIGASNGVIHAIDHVLFPADLLQALIQPGTTMSPTG